MDLLGGVVRLVDDREAHPRASQLECAAHLIGSELALLLVAGRGRVQGPGDYDRLVGRDAVHAPVGRKPRAHLQLRRRACLARERESPVDEVRHRFGLDEPIVRLHKLGRKLYVEVDFVVEPGEWDVSEEDDVRRAVAAGLEPLGLDVWAYVELTTDRALVE